MKLKFRIVVIAIALASALISLGVLVSSLEHAPFRNTGENNGEGNKYRKLGFIRQGANKVSPYSNRLSSSSENQPDNPVADKPVIVIDPGHGGEDMGTVRNGLIESRINLDIARRLYHLLDCGKYAIHMTRIGDSSLDSLSEIEGTFEQKDLDARMRFVKSCAADLFVSLHLDSFPESPSTSGSIAYYHTAGCPGSQELAEHIQESLNSTVGEPLGRPDFDAREGDFFLLRNSPIPAVLVETAFITSSSDRKLLKSEDFRNRIAVAIAKGIENWLTIQRNKIK